MKTCIFHQVKMTLRQLDNHKYSVEAIYRGLLFQTTFTDPEIYDYCDQDYYDKADKNWAKRACYDLIRKAAS